MNTFTQTGELDSLQLKDSLAVRDFFTELIADPALRASAMSSYLNDKGNYKYAESVLEEAVKQFPDDAELYQILMTSYLKLDKKDESYRAFLKWEKLTDNE